MHIRKILINLPHLCGSRPLGLSVIVTVDKSDSGLLGIFFLIVPRFLRLAASGKCAENQKKCQKKCKYLFHSPFLHFDIDG